jgi:hypothetical protein
MAGLGAACVIQRLGQAEHFSLAGRAEKLKIRGGGGEGGKGARAPRRGPKTSTAVVW